MDLIGRDSRRAVLPRAKALRAPRRGSLQAAVQLWTLALVWSLMPSRLLGVPATLALVARRFAGLGSRLGEVPDPARALRHPDGLVDICTDMSPRVLRSAYAKGLYPFAHIGPQKWWAPRQRMVLFFEDFHVEWNLRRKLRRQEFRVTFDRDFDSVIRACAEPRPGRYHLTWIRPDIIEAFSEAHAVGLAHSVEVWDRAGALVGGAYGLAVGRVFFTESQFARMRDASKAGFAVLNCHLQRWGFRLNDGKHLNPHLAQLGFTLVPRSEFNALLATSCGEDDREGRWAVDDSLDVAQWNPKAPAA